MTPVGYLWLLQLLLLAAVPWAQESEKEAEKAAAAGKKCRRSEHHWQVVLYNGTTPYCSGVLLTRWWVVTTAHCQLSKYKAYLGKHHLKKRGRSAIKIKAYESYPHPDYSPVTHANDIMLIKLKKPTRLGDGIGIAHIPAKCVSPGASCNVTGWGITTSPKETYPDKIQCTDVNVISNSDCKNIYQDKIQDSMLCAVLPNSTMNACNGGSGGPLVCRRYLQGIYSWGGSTCGQPNEPGVCAKVCQFMPWITKIMKT